MMTWQEQRQAGIARGEARRRALLDAIAEAGAVLREANLTTFRGAMRALFARHPILESVRIEQIVAYNDEFYAIDIDDLWVNGQYVFQESILEGYQARDAIPYVFSPDDRPPQGITFGTVDGPVDPFYETLAYPPRSASAEEKADAAERIEAALREHFGPLYDAALDATRTLRSLRERWGRHFFWDAFGVRAAVEVRRGEIRITSDVHSDWAVTDAEHLGADWPRRYLGSLTAEYLTCPERKGRAGLREAYWNELRRVEHALIRARLQAAAGALRLRRPKGYTLEHDRITRLHLGEHDLPVWDGKDYTGGPWLLPLVGIERAKEPPWPPPAEPYYDALHEAVGTDLADTVRTWADAIVEVRATYGLDAFNSLPALEHERTYRF